MKLDMNSSFYYLFKLSAPPNSAKFPAQVRKFLEEKTMFLRFVYITLFSIYGNVTLSLHGLFQKTPTGASTSD